MQRHLPALEHRASLARTCRRFYRYFRQHDAPLRQMWCTWAVPGMPNDVRSVMLAHSNMYECVSWAWHRWYWRSTINELAILGNPQGFLDRIVRTVNSDDVARRNIVTHALDVLFKHKHTRVAMLFYDTHFVPLVPTRVESIRCIDHVLLSCDASMEAHAQAWVPGEYRNASAMRVRALAVAKAHCNRAALEYHLALIEDTMDAIQAMGCAVVMSEARGEDMGFGDDLVVKRARDAGIADDVIDAQFQRGVHGEASEMIKSSGPL